MASPLLTHIGIPILSQILADVLGTVQHPAAQTASRALSSLEQAIVGGQISQEQLEEANRHAEKMTSMQGKEYVKAISELNKSYRTDINSDDKFVRRMRPTFGYFMAISWAVQMMSIAYVMVFRTREAHLVIEAVGSLSMIWTVGLSVLGVYVYKRSEDKRTQVSALLSRYYERNEIRGGRTEPVQSGLADHKAVREGKPPSYNE